MITTEALYEIYQSCQGVTTDSRRAAAGALFFALRGEHFDGNDYVQQALQAGAAYAVVDRPAAVHDDRCLLVADSLAAMQALARHHRRQFECPVIAITGSNGKTTTKELVASVLGKRFLLHFTQGNLNNHIGVPLSLLAMPSGTQMAVIEMGANHQGEIDELSRIAEPSHGLITNIGKAHFEGFGGLEGVKKGKSELYRFLAAAGGLAFVNQDERFLLDLAAPCEQQVRYGQAREGLADNLGYLPVELVAEQPFVSVAFRCPQQGLRLEARSQLIGHYNFQNIMTAVALGLHFGVPGVDIKAAVEGYQPGNMRSQWVESGGNTFLLDAYNANPTSMSNALLAFCQVASPKRVAILGEMLELGPDSPEEHEAIVNLALGQPLNEVVLVGQGFAEAARQHGLLHFEDVAALRAWFDGQAFSGVHFLVKGSRGNRLEGLLTEAKHKHGASS